MHQPRIKHTIDIFQHMSNNLPPLLPKEVKKEIDHALDHLHNDYTISLENVEDIVISLGKKVWPYWKAFQELVDMEQGKLGEKFLLGKLSPDLKKRYKEFKEYGATFHDLYFGGAVTFFNIEERGEILTQMIETNQEVRKYMIQSVLTKERKKYEGLILDFQEILDDVEKRLDSLRLVAEDEEEHPSLADEIRDQVRSFEFGLCLLGPNLRHEEVNLMEDFFFERKGEKKIYRTK